MGVKAEDQIEEKDIGGLVRVVKVGQQITIGDDIKVIVLGITRHKARLFISAPKSTKILAIKDVK